MWDATVFGVFNDNFPLYIKHEDLSKIAHGGQCLSISIIQLWILHMTETSMRAGNVDVYGFLEPQSIQRSGQSQFESEKLDAKVKEGLVKPGKYTGSLHIGKWSLFFLWKMLSSSSFVHCIIGQILKGIINRQKGSTECEYYVMHCMSTIILGSFKNNWEMIIYFNDTRSLMPERLKALRIQSASNYLKVKNETINV
ncbi:hypothetical protein GmHk_01G001426 [Glycine max]|nr:hypothetical protein GmHk_01G001426 [Glycine max]